MKLNLKPVTLHHFQSLETMVQCYLAPWYIFCNHSYATTLRNLNFRMIRQANAKYINRFVRQASASTTIPIPTKPVYRDLDPGWWYKLIIILVCSYRMNHTVWFIRHPAKKHEKFMTEWFELITLVNVVPMLFIMDSGMFWKIQILVISSRLDYRYCSQELLHP